MTSDTIIHAICPSCSEKNGVAPSFIGKKVICQKCETVFIVSGSGERSRASAERTSPEPLPELIPIESISQPPTPGSGLPSDPGQIPVIAKLALIYKFIDKSQCMKVVNRWQQEIHAGKKISIEDLFKIMGVLTPAQIDHLNASKEYLEIKKTDKLLCSLAVEKGFIQPAEAAMAMDAQANAFREKKVSLRAGDILVKAEILTENEHLILLKEWGEYARQNPDAPSLPPVEPEQETSARDEKEPGEAIRIRISEDHLRAYLSLSSMARNVTLDDVKKILTEHTIQFGVIDDKVIDTFIHDWAGADKELKIAEGVYPVQGENAYVRFLFDVNHLKVGVLTEDGMIDFKNRGIIPCARQGDPLAEKVPLKPGKSGVDIHGYPVEVKEVSDIDIICGQGVSLSPDKCQAIADIDGYPTVSLSQVVNVYPGIHIKGDVGFETGHVIFEGHIQVDGVVKEGFKIKGTGLSAQEIAGAEIDVSGDVVVQGGIIGATIVARGNVKAMYVRDSQIAAYGDIIIGKQIWGSTILSSGACLVPEGWIVTSDIAAKKGIRAKEIGTDVSSPNRLRSGVDLHIDKEIDRLKKTISQKENLKEALSHELHKTESNLTAVYNVIAEMAHYQDRLLHKKEAIMETIAKFEQKQKNRKLVHAEKALQEIQEQVKANDLTMDRLFATQNAYQDKMSSLREKIKAIEGEILEWDVEKKAILAWASREKGDTTILVSGAIQEKTVIFGVHSSKILAATYRNVRIKEVRLHDPASPVSYEIRVYESGSGR